MFAGRRTFIVVALAGVAALYFGRSWLGFGEPAAPEPAAAPDGRATRDEPPAADAGVRPAVRPLDALFLGAEVSRQREKPVPRPTASPQTKPLGEPGSILRLLATNNSDPIDAERREERLRELGLGGDGRTLSFDARTAGVPSRHDALLRALAALAGPELAGVEFEERSPGGAAGDYELWAYPARAGEAASAGRAGAGAAGPELKAVPGEAASPGQDAGAAGLVLRTTALNFGPWYDLDAVLGLLNVLLEDRGSELRFVCLVTSNRIATVLAGPGPGIQAAVAEGLIEVGEASYAMNAGRVAEERDSGAAP